MVNIEPQLIGTSTDPAANTEHNYQLVGNGPFKITAVQIPLVTDANVANRSVVISFTDANDIVFYKITHSTAITASKSATLQAVGGLANEIETGDIHSMALPPNFIVPSGTKIKTTTANIQATDNYGVMNVFGYKERWNNN